MSGPLIHSAADIIRYLLIAMGQGTLPTDALLWPIYQARIPETPDNCITTTTQRAGKTAGFSTPAEL